MLGKRGVERPALIAASPDQPLDGVPIETVLRFSDRSGVARFLEENDLVEPIVKARGIDAAAILRQPVLTVHTEKGLLGAVNWQRLG